MGLFNLFKKPEPKCPAVQEQSFDEFMADLRAQRLADRQPVLSRGPVPNAPTGFDHFDLSDIVIGTEAGQHDWYLFAGNNAATLSNDVRYLNRFAEEAAVLAPGVPSLVIDPVTIAFDPFPDKERQSWHFSRLFLEPPTETGRMKKYPVTAMIETITGDRSGRLYYTPDGQIGKGSVVLHVNPHSKEFVSYSMDFINGVVSHVWKNTADGKLALYNKNGSL